MDWEEIRGKARERLNGYCRVCKDCNGRGCAGEVPGMGGTGEGRSFINNCTALSEILLNMRTVHDAVEPDTSVEVLGQKLSLPALAAPMTGVSYNMGGPISELEFVQAIIQGSIQAGTLGMIGDGADPAMYGSGIQAISEAEGRGIPVIKPREQKEIFRYLAQAEQASAPAVGIDIDGAGLVTMAMKGQPVGPKTVGELKEIIQSTELPFILKGIMTPDEAIKAVEAGAAGIVVSNHGGRVLDCTPGVAHVLPEIVSAVKGEVVIFADGGVRSGIDILKLIALGADSVLIGRPLAIAAVGGGAEGVRLYFEKLKAQLFQAMILTGCSSISGIDGSVIRKLQ
ncbi:MAG TPA: alpha-hydroxy-acid oxidizing protein [Clostridia bacterium]|nr:alpha-hydroxy-acid oxidizing protein [Clostridia bacterium]